MLLRRRLLLLFVGMVLGVVVLGGVARAVVRARDDAITRARTVRVAREQVERLRVAYVDQENGERGFVLNLGDLQAYTEGRQAESQVVRSLRGVTGEIKEIAAPLDRVVATAGRWRAEAAQSEIDQVEAGNRQGALDSIATGTGANLMERVRANVDTLDARVAAVSAASDDRAATTRRQLTSLIVLFLVLLLAGVLAAAWLIRRWVTRPIDQLVSDVRRARSGDLDDRIRAAGPPEIAELAEDIEEMRRSIDEQRVNAERAREAVEQNATVVLALRSQLEPEVGELPEGWTIAAELRAAEGVAAGDCYDLVRLSGGRLLGLIVVDIAGHGATEGILALRCKELLRASLAADVSPGEAIEAAAEQLGEMGPEVFLTTFVAVVDTEDGSIRYANAGHPPAFISSERADVDLDPTGPLVGPIVGSSFSCWDTRTATMEPGDNLCAYTDGVIEIRNAESEFYGPDRLHALIRGSRCDQASAIVKRCLDEAELFAPGRMHDDATIVILCRPEHNPSSLTVSPSEV